MINRLLIAVIIGLLTIGLIPAAYLQTHSEAATNTLADSFGRQVKVSTDIERIACLYAFTGHVVAMLGRGDDIVAVSNGLQRDVLLTTLYPAIRKALVPYFQGAVNIEELAKAKPDIVFVSAETGRNSAETAKLDACGLTWLVIDFHSMEQQQQAIALIGQAIGASEKAAVYNSYYRSCISRAAQGTAPIPPEIRARVYHATNEPTRTSPRQSLPEDWIRAAGLINVASQESPRLFDGRHHVSIEQILLWNPDVILANEPGVAASIQESPAWGAIAAVRNGCVHQLPIGISRWGHPGSLETPLAILWTVKTVYPERFMAVDIHSEIGFFYKTFFNYDLSEEIIEQILSGRGMRLTKSRK